uniref:Uncharacterized protein n=1 Tax=Populus trichocarpa TaxID=3694 RepID=A0A3N7FIQ7_POPTR
MEGKGRFFEDTQSNCKNSGSCEGTSSSKAIQKGSLVSWHCRKGNIALEAETYWFAVISVAKDTWRC